MSINGRDIRMYFPLKYSYIPSRAEQRKITEYFEMEKKVKSGVVAKGRETADIRGECQCGARDPKGSMLNLLLFNLE